ncbi:MAG: hypothetical protein ACI9GW_000595 [Halieaceae bacterium]|jgi:uncharacterized protein (DUF2062 family)
MPRRFFKRHLPKPGQIKKVRSLRLLGKWVYQPRLWHVGRNATAGAFFIGLFCAFIPLPIQIFFAAGLAIWWRCNLPIAVGLVWISNPLTMPPLFYGAYVVGAYALGIPSTEFRFDASWAVFGTGLQAIWQPLLLGCLICGVALGSVGYVAIDVTWRLHVARRWRARPHRLRKRASKEVTPNAMPGPVPPKPPFEQESTTLGSS